MTLDLFYDLYSHLSRQSHKFDLEYSKALRRFKRLEDKVLSSKRVVRVALTPTPAQAKAKRKVQTAEVGVQHPDRDAAEGEQHHVPQQPRYTAARR
jgi:hypothetical protein